DYYFCSYRSGTTLLF
nr:immunoglobulin light chain junction region [Macaca mulatta]